LLPKVYPILDIGSLARVGGDPVVFLEGLLEGGARIVQLRRKGEYGAAEVEQARRMAEMCRAAGAVFVVNDRVDVAAAVGAGAHVGQGDVAPGEARRAVGGGVVGYSTHNAEQLRAGDDEPVDYLAIGPIFGTSTKENPDPVVGVEGLRALRHLTEKPLVAIGGITESNAREVLAAGADAVAVIAGLLEGMRPGEIRVETVKRRMQEWQATVR
jgi:thiamine-phosphate pyrophosphorylase